MKARFIIVLLALAMLCTSVLAQENAAEDWYKKGRDLGRNGSYEEAVLAYNRAIELEPNNATFYTSLVPTLNTLAFTTNNQSKRNESLEAIDKALEIDPKNPIAWEQKGSMLYYQTKRYNESLEAYDKAIENISSYSPDNQLNQTEFLSYIWTSKSIALWQLMRYNESLEAVDKSVQIDPAGNYDAWAFKGELLAYLGRYNESLKAFDGATATEAARSRPEIRALPWAAEGYVLMQMGRYDEADRIYQKIIGLNFTSEGANRHLADAWRGSGNALAKLGKFNESLQAFNKSIETSQEIAPYAWTGKGDILLASGRYEEAVNAYGKALELYPKDADTGIASAQKGRGDALDRLGKHSVALAAYSASVKASDKAVSAFNNATPVDKAVSFTLFPYPLDRVFWHNRAFALHSIGREAEAEEASAMAQENTAGYWIEKGNELVDNGSYEEALAKYDKAIQIDPENIDTWDRKALVLYILEQQAYRNVLSLSEKRLKKNPKDARAWQTLVAAHSSLGEEDEANSARKKALEIYEQEIQENPGNTTAWFYKAELTTNSTEALAAYEKVIELNGSMKISALITKSNILLNIGKSDEATLALDEAIRLSPNSSDVLIQKALNSFALGKYNESLEAYEKIIELKPKTAWLWKGKGDALVALGRQAEADRAYAKAKELGLVV